MKDKKTSKKQSDKQNSKTEVSAGHQIIVAKKSRAKYIAASFVAVVFVAAFIGYSMLGNPQPVKKYGTIDEKIKAEFDAANAKRTRPDYLPPVVYKNLPPFPGDFYVIDLLIYAGRLTDLVTLEEKYWKQPEFYPLFEEKIDIIANPTAGRFYGIGYGAYPGDIGVEASPGDDFTVASFFHTSWLVETYQGTKMEVVFPESSVIPNQDLNGTQFNVTQSPDQIKNYFEVTTNPEVFLLEPVNPIFGYNWTVKVLIHIKVMPETPKGRYVIGINPSAPPKEYSLKWTRQYLTKYNDAASGVGGRPYVRIIADIK